MGLNLRDFDYQGLLIKIGAADGTYYREKLHGAMQDLGLTSEYDAEIIPILEDLGYRCVYSRTRTSIIFLTVVNGELTIQISSSAVVETIIHDFETCKSFKQ